MTSAYLRSDLERDEGVRRFPYRDSRGIWTIGCGCNMQTHPALMARFAELQANGMSAAEIDGRLGDDIAAAEVLLDRDLPWWRRLSDLRQDVMVNLAFNLGEGKLATWRHTLSDIAAGAFKAAEIDLMNDEPWASQVHARATRLALQMESDVHQGPGAPEPGQAPAPAPPPPPAPVTAGRAAAAASDPAAQAIEVAVGVADLAADPAGGAVAAGIELAKELLHF
jgi:lysozyme